MSKYKSPINKPEMVSLPRWEYARLIAQSNTLAILRTMVENDKGYDEIALFKMLIEKEKEAGEIG